MSPFDAPTLSENQSGTVFGDQSDHGSQWEVCVVTEIYPERHTCAVITESNQFYTGVNWPGDGSTAPRRGDDYLISHNAGKPVLVDAENKSQLGVSTSNTDVSIEDEVGGSDPAMDERGFGLSHEEQPGDVLPGDWVKSGDLGNLIGVLEGGTNVFKASEIAKIIASKTDHLIKILGKNLSLLSEGATLELETEDGKSSIVLRAGKDSETSTHPSVEDFQVRCEIGAEGDMVDFRITDRKGRIKYRQHVDSDGRVDNVNQQEVKETRGDKKETVEGDCTEEVRGQTNRTYGGSVSEEMAGNYTQNVAGSARIKAAKNMAMQAIENLSVSARKHIDMKSSGYIPGVDSGGPGDAWNVDITNGNVQFDIGNPVKGDFFGGAKSDFNVDTYAGDINFFSRAGTFNVKTLRPGSVNLGGPVPGAFSGVLYETLSSVFQAFITIFDAHTHIYQSPGGPQPTAPPLPLASPTVSPLLPLMKSRFVSFGG